MAVLNITQLKALFEAGDTPSENDFIDLIDTLFSQGSGGGVSVQNEGAQNSDLSLTKAGGDVTYQRTAAGIYDLDVPADCKLIAASIEGVNTMVDGSSQFTLVIDDSDSQIIYPILVGVSVETGSFEKTAQNIQLFPGVTTNTAGGETTTVWPNLNFGSSEFKLFLTFHYAANI